MQKKTETWSIFIYIQIHSQYTCVCLCRHRCAPVCGGQRIPLGVSPHSPLVCDRASCSLLQSPSSLVCEFQAVSQASPLIPRWGSLGLGYVCITFYGSELKSSCLDSKHFHPMSSAVSSKSITGSVYRVCVSRAWCRSLPGKGSATELFSASPELGRLFVCLCNPS